MTDLPEHETHEDQILLDAFDGDEAARATVAADPRLAALFEAISANRDSLIAAEPTVDPATKAAAMTAAMSVFDDMQASAAGAEAAAAVTARKRRSLRLFRSAGALAASAAVVVGIVAIAPNLSTSGSGDSTASDTASATTAAPAATTAAAQAAPEATRSAAETTTAPATTQSDAMTTTTSAEVADAAAEGSAPEEVAADGPAIDPRLLECAEIGGLDSTTWLSSTDIVPQPGTGPYVQIAVMLDDGFEIMVVFDPATCDINSVSEPAEPAAGDQ